MPRPREISDIYARRGLRGLVFTIENRALRPGANLYLVTTPAGQAVAGNVGVAGARRDGQDRLVGDLSTGRLDDQDARRITARWCASPNCRAGSGCWSAAISQERRRLFGVVANAAQWSVLIVDRARARRRHLRRAAGAAADRRHDRHHAADHGRRPVRPAAGRPQRRRTRPAGGKPQRHAGADRGADERPQGSLRQHRPRPEDAADAAAQPRRGGAGDRPAARPNTAPRWSAPSRNPTG